MGIRVKKIVGYGLTDLSYDTAGRLIDERLNPKGYLMATGDAKEEAWTASGYHAFLKQHGCEPFDKNPDTPFQDMLCFHMDKPLKRHWDPWDSVIYDGEFGMPNVVVVIPYCQASKPSNRLDHWRRNDDIIDYCEERETHGCLPRILELKDGIYPFDGYETPEGETVPLQEVSTYRYLNKPLRPRVPNEIRALCAYLKLFKDPKTARTMKPLLYVYWA